MEELGRRVAKIWTACDSPSRKSSIHTCSELFKPGQNFSHLFNFPLAKAVIFLSYVQDLRYPADVWCAILLKLHINRELSNSARLEQLYRNYNVDPSSSPYYSDHVRSLRNVIFCIFECSYSSVLRPILVKLHILTCLIESFPTLYGLWSCIEKEMSIPLAANGKRFERRNFFSVMSCPAEKCIFQLR